MSDAAPPPRRPTSLRTVLVGAAAVVILMGGIAVVSTRGGPPPPAVAGSGQVPLAQRPAPGEDFALPAATLGGFAGGPAVNVADFRGTPLIVNFWATWCAPCVKEMPEFQEVAAQAGDKVVFLGVDVEDAPSNAEPFVQRLGIDYPLAIDPRREFSNAVNNFGMPTTLFVDPDGIVRYRHTGPLDAAQLRALLAEHLEVTL